MRWLLRLSRPPLRRLSFSRFARAASLPALLASASFIALFASACASDPPSNFPTYAATNFQPMNPNEPRDQARREAMTLAEGQAREQIREQVYQMRLSDGRTLGDLSAIDPFVRAVIQDTLRNAQIEDRGTTNEGLVTVTVKMELAPLYKMISEYPNHAIR